jgi:PAS domain S-box-containing protein
MNIPSLEISDRPASSRSESDSIEPSKGLLAAWLPQIIIFTVVGSLILGGTMLYFIHNKLVKKDGQHLALIAANIADKLRTNVMDRKTDLTFLALAVSQEEYDPHLFLNQVAKMGQENRAYFAVMILSLDGRVTESSIPDLVGQDLSEEPVLTQVRKDQAFHVDDAKPLKFFQDRRGLTLAAPILGEGKRLQGFVLGFVGTAFLRQAFEFTTHALDIQHGKHSTFEWQLLKRDGSVIVDSVLKEEGNLNLQSLGVPSALLVGNNPTGYVEEQHLRRHVPVITGYAKTGDINGLPDSQWHVLVRRDRQAVLAGLQEIESQFILVGVGLLIPLMALLFVATRKLRNAYADTTHALKLVAEEKTQLAAVTNRLQLATKSAHMGIWEWDVLHNTLTLDEHMDALYGIQPQNFSGTYEAWIQAIHPDDQDRIHQEIQLARKDKKEFHAEFRVIWPDQSIHWLESHAMVEGNSTGTVLCMIGISVDITQRKQAEEQFRLGVEAAPSGMLMVNEEGHITMVNSLTCEQFGYSRDELIGQPIEILVPQRFRSTHPEKRAGFFANPEHRAMGSGRDLFGLRKNGSEFPVEIGLNPVRTDQGHFVLASVVDITQRKQAEEQFRHIVEGAPSGMIMVNEQGQITLVNALTCSNFGYTREELLHQPIEVLIPERFRATHPEKRTNFFANPEHRAMGKGRELFGLRKDGSEFPIEIGLNPICTEQGNFVLASVVDITDRKLAEQEREERNILVAFEAKIIKILNEIHDVQALLQACSEVMVEYLHVAFARIWILRPDEQILELQASAGLYTHLDGSHGRIPVGQFKIGKIASERKPHLTNHVIGDPQVPEQDWAKEHGMVAFAGYPLLMEHKVLGVMGVFSQQALSPRTLHVMELVGARISQALDRIYTEKKIQALAARNALLLTSAGEGIYGIDTQGIATFVNPAAAKMLGYTPEELLGIPMHSKVHYAKPDGAPYPREECPMYAAFQDGVAHIIDNEVLWRKDGTSFPVLYTSTPARDVEGNIVGAVVTFSDITERKHAEEELRDREHRLSMIVESAPNGLIMADEHGHMMMVNSQLESIFGYSREELLGQPVEILIPERFHQSHVNHRREYEANPEPRKMARGRELLGLHKNGTEIPIEISLKPIQLGKKRMMLAMVVDLTELKQSQAMAEELSKRNELILESAAEGIYGVNVEGNAIFINPAGAHMLGYEPEELLGKPMVATVHHTKSDGTPNTLVTCPTKTELQDAMANEVMWRKNGTAFPVEYTRTPLWDQTHLVGAVTTFRDITERKQAEEALLKWTQALERSNKELDDFAYIASHDLKEPLRGIHNYSRFLIEDYATLLGEEGSEQCQTIMRLSQRMEELINTLLYYSRLGRTDLAIRDVDLDRVVLDVLDTLKPRLEEENVSIRYPNPLPTLRCDEARVGEIFRNLITNSMKYNDKPDKWIEIGCEAMGSETRETLGVKRAAEDGTENEDMPPSHKRPATSNKGLKFYVRDNGIGIPEKHFGDIFRIFKRLQGRDKFGGGTGAGLTIIQKIVHRHGGKIWVESTVGEGTTFWFTLESSSLSSPAGQMQLPSMPTSV